MRHTTSLRILEESLLLKCLFNLEENLGSAEEGLEETNVYELVQP